MNRIGIDDLAQEIRRIDGDHSQGAGQLAEALWPFFEAALRTTADTEQDRKGVIPDFLIDQLEYVDAREEPEAATQLCRDAAKALSTLSNAPQQEADPVAWISHGQVITDAGEAKALRAAPLFTREAEPVAWRDVQGYEDAYEISSAGDLRNKHSGLVQSKHLAGAGYVKADLWKDGQRKQTTVHRLVAEAFLPNPEGKPEVNHLDGDKTNNHAENLEWCTRAENEQHAKDVLGHLCKPIVATVIGTGEVEHYPSTEAAARSLGCSTVSVWKALNGRRASSQDRTWSYAPPPASPTPSQDGVVTDALKRLLDAARKVQAKGAVTGFQWTELALAIGRARAALNKGGE